MLNRRGRIEMEMTIVKMGKGRYYLTCAAFFEQRLLDHLAQNQNGEDVTVTNLSDDWFAMALQGPKSKAVLEDNTDASLELDDFKWLKGREMEVAGHKVWGLRMSYAGEQGWEFHGPRNAMLPIYKALWASGEKHGIANYGSFAMNSLRMEKMFPGASELTNEVTLPEANVMRFVRVEKGEFQGREQTIASMETDRHPWLCVYLAIEDDGEHDGHGGEAVLFNGKSVGTTSSMAYGHAVGKIMAFAYVKPEAATPGQALEVVIAAKPRKAVVMDKAIYDPMSEKPRGVA